PTNLSGATDDELLSELRSRDVVLSAWSVEDVVPVIEEDEEFGAASDEEIRSLASDALAFTAKQLEDVLGSRGNEHLSDMWPAFKDEIIAARSDKTPAA